MRERLIGLLIIALNVLSVILLSFIMATAGFSISFLVQKFTSILAIENTWPYFPFVLLLAVNAIHGGIYLASKVRFFNIILIISYAIGFLFYVNLQMGNMLDISKIFLLFLCLLYASFYITDRIFRAAR